MAVSKIEEYRQKDGNDVLKVYLNSSKIFSNGDYFYTDVENIDLVKSYGWNFRSKNQLYISETRRDINGVSHSTYFHRHFALKLLGYIPECLDHINNVGLDNIDVNLNVTDYSENGFNKRTKGYSTSYDKTHFVFRPRLKIQGTVKMGSTCRDELSACIAQYAFEHDLLNYKYNFLLDRRNDLDILDLERTGVISQDEATYYHVLKYADNAWYYYRYGLENYFRQHHILVPSYSLDEQGFMIHPITGQKLCPF